MLKTIKTILKIVKESKTAFGFTRRLLRAFPVLRNLRAKIELENTLRNS